MAKSVKTARLSEKSLASIRQDAELFGKVASVLNIKPASLLRALERNGQNLASYAVVKVVADHLNVHPDKVVD